MQNETTNQTPAREAPDSSVRPVKVKRPRKLRSLAEASLTINLPMVKEPVGTLEPLRTPEATAALLNDMRHLAQEAFVVLTLTTRYRVINRHLITLGILDAALVHPREVFRAAISDGAAAIVIAHNHPSGDPSPSAEDIRITRQMVDAGRILQIEVLDHVIIGRAEAAGGRAFVSLREAGLVAFH